VQEDIEESDECIVPIFIFNLSIDFPFIKTELLQLLKPELGKEINDFKKVE
jgi:hypothetical protein